MYETSIEFERILIDRYHVDPPDISMTLKNVEEIYKLCEEAQKTKWSLSELFLNASAFVFGVGGMSSTILNANSNLFPLLVRCLLVLAIVLYLLYIHFRRDDFQQLNIFAKEVIHLLPVSKETIEYEKANAAKHNELRISLFEKHLKNPAYKSHEETGEE